MCCYFIIVNIRLVVVFVELRFNDCCHPCFFFFIKKIKIKKKTCLLKVVSAADYLVRENQLPIYEGVKWAAADC